MSAPPSFEEFRARRNAGPNDNPPTFEDFKRRQQGGGSDLVGGAVGSAIEDFKRGVSTAVQDIAGGGVGSLAFTNNQLANFAMVLDKAATGLSEVTGLDRGGAFARLEEWFRTQAEAQQRLAVDLSPNRAGIIDDLNRFLGSLPVELPKMAAAVSVAGPVGGFAGLGALSEAEGGPVAAAEGAVRGALEGQVFKVAAPLGRLGRAGSVTSGVAAIESAAGAEPGEALTAGATAGILAGVTGGPGRREPPRPQPFDLADLRARAKPRIKLKVPEKDRPLVEATTQAKAAADKVTGGNQPTRLHLEGDRVLNLNLRRIQGPDDLKAMQRFLVEEFRPQINEARRGVITQQETQRMAESLGITVDDLLKRRRGQALNAEELTAARVLHQSIAKELFDRARLVSRGQATDNAKADLVNLVALYEASAKQALGATAEAGRALSSLRIIAGPSRQHLADIRELMSQFKNVTRGQEVEAFAEMISRLESPGALTKTVEASRKPKLSDKFIEVYINGLLSNPTTQVVNALSNSLTALWTIPEAYVAGAFGGLKSSIARGAGRPKPERVFLREGDARLFGFIEGAKDGLRLAGRTLRTGETSDAFGKIESRRGSIGGPIGRVVRVPGDLLLAGDEFFKAIGMRQEIRARAVRRAAMEGKRGQAFRERVAQLTENPTEATREAAIQTARHQTFTEPLGQVGRAVISFSNSHPLFKLILPFVRTPTNIFKFAAKRSPLAPTFADVRADLLSKGAAREQALARMTFGTMTATAVAALAAEGQITGSGPADPETRAAWFAAGNRPYSFKMGDRQVSFARLEPLGTIVGIAADYAQVAGHMTEDEREEVAALIWLSFRKNVENKTFLQGLTSLMLATSDPNRFGDRFLGRVASGMIPASALSGHIARQSDPVLRRADSIIESVKARVPGFSQTLEPRINIWGEPITLDGGLGPDFVSPLYSHRKEPDFATEEVLRTGAQLSKPKDVVQDVELTPKERTRLEQTTGRIGKLMIDQLVADPQYRRMPKVLQREAIEDLYASARAIARTQAFTTILTHEPTRYRKVVRETIEALTENQ